MDEVVLNNLLDEMLLAELGDGFDSVADRLIQVHDRLARIGTDPTAVGVLRTVLIDLGWWRGRIDEALENAARH